MVTMLLVDPTPIVRSALRDLLESKGHGTVDDAIDVPTALNLAREKHPQLVILEMSLPGADCLDLLRRLKARDPEQMLLVYSGQNPAHFTPLAFRPVPVVSSARTRISRACAKPLSMYWPGARISPGNTCSRGVEGS